MDGGNSAGHAVRGAVVHKNRATQERDFTGLRYGAITPTDIDGVIEYKNKCYIFYEAKCITAPPMSRGQALAFERLCDDLQKIKPTIVISLEHNFPANEPIDFASCKVKSCRWKGKWIDVKADVTVKKVTDWFIKKYGEADVS